MLIHALLTKKSKEEVEKEIERATGKEPGK